MNFDADLLRNRQNLLSYTPKEQLLQGRNGNLHKMPFLPIFFPRDTRIVHTLFTPNLGLLKESTLYFSHSLKQRATNKNSQGPLSPLEAKARPKKTTAARCYDKDQGSVQANSTGESFPSFSRRCCLLRKLNSLRGPFQILPRPARAVCGWGGAAGRPFRTCRTLSGRTPCGPARCGHLHSSSPRSSRGESAWCS